MAWPEAVLLTVSTLTLIALAVVIVRLRAAAPAHGGADSLRQLDMLTQKHAELERRLAVSDADLRLFEETRSLLADREARNSQLRDEKARTEAGLAVAQQEIAGLNLAARELRERLAASDASRRDVEAQFKAVAVDKVNAQEAVAVCNAGLQAADTTAADLRARLAHAEDLLKQGAQRATEMRGEVASAHEALAARTEALRRVEEKGAGLSRQVEALGSQADALRAELTQARIAHSALTETLEQERAQAAGKLDLIVKARAEMSDQFKTLAEQVAAQHGETFAKANQQQIAGILDPLRTKIGEFEQKVHASQIESVKERASLAEQIRSLAETGAVMGRETKELTEALRGRSQVQGAWGEMVLASVLERSGLRKGEEYAVQQSLVHEDGRRLRPDVIIYIPGGPPLVVDAKVSLTAFDSLVNAESDPQRLDAQARHATSIRNHIAELGSKAYHAAAGPVLDYVIMFVPIEGALAAALQADAGLLAFAAERNVALATPTTLMVAMRTVANVWKIERRNLNAEDIAKRAGLLYDKFVGFVDDLEQVKQSFARSGASLDSAMARLSTGNGNLVRQAEKLKEMGARAQKALKPDLVAAAVEAHTTVHLTAKLADAEITLDATSDVLLIAPEGLPHPPVAAE